MINTRKDIKELFGESIKNLIDYAQKKWDETYEKIEQEKRFKEDCKESRDEIENSINRINEIFNLDLTTAEGYSEYMKYLGDLRIRVKEYDNLLKTISGKTGTEIIDEIAQKATTFYEENKNKKYIEEPVNENKPENVVNDSQIKKDENSINEWICNPSSLINDETIDSIENIVEKYINESLLPNYGGRLREDDLNWLTDELIEFSCWLTMQSSLE